MKQILIEDYNYPLADERIAKYPLDERDSSKLLIYRDGGITEDHFAPLEIIFLMMLSLYIITRA